MLPLTHSRALGAVAAVLLLAGCATLRVDSYADRTADFSRYRTYDWAPVTAFSTGDPRLDNNPFFQERLRSDVDRQLTTRGLERSGAVEPDLLLHYHASVSQRIDVGGLDQQYGSCPGGDCEPFVYEGGTIVLDLVDARTNRLVWRGWADGSLEGAIDNQEWMEARIDDAVRRILERLPRPLAVRSSAP